ncbi:MAG: VOC family protein [Candidatus Nanopelagicales bacterium]
MTGDAPLPPMPAEPYPVLTEGARFDHVCVAGPALDPLLGLYVDVLGGRFVYGEVLPLGAVVVTVEFAGGGHVELMAPTPGSAFLDSFLARTGGLGGLHHVTFVVPDLRSAVAEVVSAGGTVFGERYEDPYWSEAFVRPRDASGVLVQLATPGPRVADAMTTDLDALRRAAVVGTGPTGT